MYQQAGTIQISFDNLIDLILKSFEVIIIMKKILLYFTISLLASCTYLFAEPLFSINKLEHDFGTIKQDITVTENIIFKNLGTSELLIEKVRTSCGCTETRVNKEKIKPKEEGILEISFNSGNYNGKITRSIYIYTNDPKNKIVIFKITAKVTQK